MSELPPLPYAEPAAPLPFTKSGNLRGPGPGRPKGSQNKITTTLKEAILQAAEKVGSDGDGDGGLQGYLETVARTDVKSFCVLLGKVLPMTIKGEGEDGSIVVEIVRMAAGRDVPHPTA